MLVFPTLKIWNKSQQLAIANGGAGAPNLIYSTWLTDYGRMVSANNAPNLRLLGKTRVGGNWNLYFSRIKREVYVVPYYKFAGSVWKGGQYACTDAARIVSPSVANQDTAIDNANSDLRIKAPTAIRYANPSNPTSDLARGLAELGKDGIPDAPTLSLWRERTHLAKSAGNEYLNAEFGWLPFVDDLRSFAKAVTRSHAISSQYEKGSKVRQRREFHYPDVELSSSGSLSNVNFSPGDTSVWSNGSVSWFDRIQTRAWFSGAFKYYIPPSGLGNYARRAQKLFGTPSPATVWAVAPWSWALDWQSNVGDAISNANMIGPDATAMEWGYMMKESYTSRHSVHTCTGFSGAGSNTSPVRGKTVSVSMDQDIGYKTRIHGNPYSFSVDLEELSSTQIAILAALGLSRT